MIILNHQKTFWENANPSNINLFELIPTAANAPNICVAVNTKGNALQLSYRVHSCDWFNTPNSECANPTRKDFLWEGHCLECFFELQGNDKRYFELNYSMGEFYNLYQFDDYRTPSHLPPVWADGKLVVVQSDLDDTEMVKYYHMSVTLDDIANMTIGKINPTAILYRDDTPIFYAVQHANPPDFHDKAFWQNI